MPRREGVYWILIPSEPEPRPQAAEWENGHWNIIGVSMDYRDDEAEVLSSRLEPPRLKPKE